MAKELKAILLLHGMSVQFLAPREGDSLPPVTLNPRIRRFPLTSTDTALTYVHTRAHTIEVFFKERTRYYLHSNVFNYDLGYSGWKLGKNSFNLWVVLPNRNEVEK